MDFLSEKFVLFFVIVTILNYCVNKKYRVYVLFLASMFFYSMSSFNCLPLIFFICLITYVFGYFIDVKNNKKILYIISVVLIVCPLFYFKYINFIFEMLNRFFLCKINFLELVIPLGISFLTFQAISYVSDIYYGNIHYERNIFKVSLFIIFFPNVSSGPIQKAKKFLPQIDKEVCFNEEKFKYGCYLIAFGALQKLCISDLLFPIINTMLNNFQNYSGFHYLFFSIIYALYIYTNFNSYSDMAIGIAKILGFDLGINFKRPYLSLSIKEFWQRWHISLNNWFVDYIYIPLGGSRKGRIRKYINIMIVFLISGLWHGAGVHFLAWGGLNAIYQIIGDLTKNIKEKIYLALKINKNTFLFKIMKRMMTFFLICISWIFFAVPSFTLSLHAIKSILTMNISTIFDGTVLNLIGSNREVLKMCIVAITFICIQILRERVNVFNLIENESQLIKTMLNIVITTILLLAWFVSFQSTGSGGFVYFDF